MHKTRTIKPRGLLNPNPTAREIEMLDLMAQGLSRVQVAEHTNLSPKTVCTHIYNVCKKLKVNNARHAYRILVERGHIEVRQGGAA
jgi:LuxR family transcriptional regulator, transcriptional regulator of spore coat protein